MIRKNRLLAILVCVALVITSCKKIDIEKISTEKLEKPEEAKPEYGGEISLPLVGLSTLNPLLSKNESYYYFNKLIYESMFEFDENLDIVEKLAESYSLEENGRIVNIRLRDDVFWHDGQKLKAEDVIFTIEAIKSLGLSSSYGSLINQALGGLDRINLSSVIEAEGSGRELRIIFDRVYGNNLEALTFPIIPAHVFSNIKEALAKDDYRLLGTGPYKFKSYRKSKELILERNEDYRGGRPYLEKVVGRIMASEEDAIRAFETGQINAAVMEGTDWEKYGKSNRMKLIEFATPNYEFLGFNFSRDIFAGPSGVHLRKAIAHAIDRDSIVGKVYLGHGVKADLPIHPDSWLNKAGSYEYDLKLANEEMKKAGYSLKDGEGFYLDDKQERLKLRLLTNSLNPMRFGSSDIIRRNLKELGLELELVPENPNLANTSSEEFDSQWNLVQGELARGNFDLVLAGWQQSIIPDPSFMFHTRNLGSSNFIRYSNETTDRLLEEAFYAGQSREDKLRAYEKLEKNLMSMMPYASICYTHKALLIDRQYYGEANPSFSDPYRGLDRIFTLEDSKNE